MRRRELPVPPPDRRRPPPSVSRRSSPSGPSAAHPAHRCSTRSGGAGSRLVDEEGNRSRADTLEVGSFATVFPEGAAGSADSQAVLIRVEPGTLQLPDERAAGAPDGYVAYSKICTHAGCALGLYLAAQQQLRCPCHQSTFDVLERRETRVRSRPAAAPAAADRDRRRAGRSARKVTSRSRSVRASGTTRHDRPAVRGGTRRTARRDARSSSTT